MKILVVEDEEDSAKALKRGLESECYAVDVEHDGERGFYRARTNDYDLIILDNMLPTKQGPEICKGIRDYKIATPILMLSGWTEVDQKVQLFNCGADDYLTKPYAFSELIARVGALLRRHEKQETPKAVMAEDIALNKENYTVVRDGRSVYLTPKEFSLLEYFIKNQGRVVSRAMILEHVWDGKVDLFTNSIETHIANLRRKIDAGKLRKLIHTVPSRGYKFGTEA